MPQTKGGPATKPKVTKPGGNQARIAEVTVVLGEAVKDTYKWNIVCLPLLGCLVFGFALSLIIVGAVHNIEDLILIGAIFLVGSLIFFFLLYLNVCRPRFNRNQVAYQKWNEGEKNPGYVPEPMPYYGSYSDDDFLQAKNKPVPTESQLYGANKHRSFLATPATAADVMFDDSQMTPPPPRVKSPFERMASPPPKLSLPSETKPGSSIRRATFDMTVNEEMQRRTAVQTHDLELI